MNQTALSANHVKTKFGFQRAETDAQEVLQRDVNDLTAQSILAVSGLRVSAEALAHLRKVNEVKGSTRNEAESVAKLIREALGEPILVAPQPEVVPEPVKRSRRVVRRVAPASAPASAPAAPAAAEAAKAPVVKPAPAPAPAAAPAPVGKATPAPVVKPVPAPVAKPASVAKPAGSTAGRANPFGALQ